MLINRFISGRHEALLVVVLMLLLALASGALARLPFGGGGFAGAPPLASDFGGDFGGDF